MKIAPTRIAKLQRQRRFLSAVTAVLTSSFISQLVWPFLENQPAFAQTSAYCQLSKEQVNQKEDLRRAALSGKPESQQAYFAVLSKHARETAECRQKNLAPNPSSLAAFVSLRCQARRNRSSIRQSCE